jgi:hypothetical protein
MTDDRNDVVIQDGKPLAMNPADVRRTVLRMVDEGEILAIIVQVPSGDIAVQVFGPPTLAVVETLEEAARSFRAAVEHAS